MPNGQVRAVRQRCIGLGRRGIIRLYPQIYLHNLLGTIRRGGTPKLMPIKLLSNVGARAWQFQVVSLSSIGLCIGLWIRAKTVDQDERGNAERRALFVGLWPPMFWLIGDTLERNGK